MKTLNNKLEIVKKKEEDLMKELNASKEEEYMNQQSKITSENYRKDL